MVDLGTLMQLRTLIQGYVWGLLVSRTLGSRTVVVRDSGFLEQIVFQDISKYIIENNQRQFSGQCRVEAFPRSCQRAKLLMLLRAVVVNHIINSKKYKYL